MMTHNYMNLLDTGDVATSAQTVIAIRYGVLKTCIYDYAVAIKDHDVNEMKSIERFLRGTRGQMFLGEIDTDYFITKMRKTAHVLAKTRTRHFVCPILERRYVLEGSPVGETDEE